VEAVAALEVLELPALVALAVVVGVVMHLLFQLLAQKILVAEEVLVETSKIILLLVVQALSLFGTPTPLIMPFQQQVLHPLQTLAVLKFIVGQALDQLRFNHGSISIANKR
jgi:hypothetical protein